MADNEKALKMGIETDASKSISELDRYNAKLKEMADRTEAAAKAVREQADAEAYAALKLEAKARMAEKAAVQAAETKAIDEQLAKSYKKLGDADVAAALAGTEATNKWSASKKQAQEALKGFAAAFPGVAAAARLFLNPITLSFAAIGLSISALREKLKGVETDFRAAAWGTERANEGAEAVERMAKALSAAKVEASGLNTELAAISTHYANVARLTKDNPLVAKREADAKSRATSGQIAELRIRSQNLRRTAAEAGRGPSALDDQNTLAGLEADAQRAGEEIKKIDEEMAFLEKYLDPDSSDAWRYGVGATQFALKYGATTNASELLTAKRSERASYQGMIDRRDSFKQRMEVNEARRKLSTGAASEADALDAQARGLEAGRRRDDFNAQVDFGLSQSERGLGVTVTPQGNGYSITPAAAQEIARLRAQAGALEQGVATLTDMMQRMQKLIDRVQAQNKNRIE